jgi:Uma2 family endonuclease
VQATGLDTYPDVSVVCGHAELDDQDASAIVNPTVLVEVLSPSTEDYDRSEKLSHYKQIPSLREVLFVAHDAKRLTLARRGPADRWEELQVDEGMVTLESLGCELGVEDVYRDPLAE